jgi:hypothetical protein
MSLAVGSSISWIWLLALVSLSTAEDLELFNDLRVENGNTLWPTAIDSLADEGLILLLGLVVELNATGPGLVSEK